MGACRNRAIRSKRSLSTLAPIESRPALQDLDPGALTISSLFKTTGDASLEKLDWAGPIGPNVPTDGAA